MAVQKINYENKEAIQNDTDIANKNKVTDADMNEIKTVVNNNANELQELQNKEVNNSTDIEQLKRNTLELQTNVNNIQQEQTTQNQKILNNSNNLDLVVDQLGETEQEFLQYKVENNQRVTYAEQNIIDLQGRERLNKEKIETLQQEVQELEQDVKANEITEETEQAKSLKITDASGARGSLKVFGNSEQETREGYNLYDNSKLEEVFQYSLSSSITITDEILTVKNNNETALSVVGAYGNYFKDVMNKLTAGQTYTFSLKTDGKYGETAGTDTVRAFVIFRNAENQEIKTTNLGSSFSADIEIPSNCTYLGWRVDVNGKATHTFKEFMIRKQGAGSTEYEEYGASPSINYPSKVQCLGSNKNLVTEVLNNLWYSTDTNKFITMQNTVSVIAEIPQNTNITIKKKNGGNRFAVVTSNAKPQLDVSLTTVFIDNENLNRKTYTFKNTDKKWVWVGVQNGGTEEDKQKAIEEIKIEEGETATSYSPMGQGSTKIKKTNRNYLDSFNYYTANTSKTINGITFKINPDGTITANGTATANAFFDFSYTHVIGTNKKMIINNIGGTATGTVRFTAYNKDFSTTTSVLRETTGTQEMNLSDNIEYSVFRYAVYQDAVCNNLTLGFMVLDKTETDRTYTQHQEENYILNIQQEMLTGDYFDLERKKEVHNWEKYEITGNESWSIANAGTANYFYQFTIKDKLNKVNQDVLPFSNCYKGARVITINSEEGVFVTIDATIRIREEKEDTIEAFKAKLQDLYNNGTPVYVWYKLSTPIELDLTESQIEVLEKLNKLRYYEGVNNILTTEDIALLQAKYSQNLKVTNTKMQQQIDEIKELLSTTQTSAILLDNLEKDLIEEVK